VGSPENSLAIGEGLLLRERAIFISETDSNLLNMSILCDKGEMIIFDKEKVVGIQE
jgi:hypothetical protein